MATTPVHARTETADTRRLNSHSEITIAICTLDPIEHDARVLRQVAYLSRLYKVVVVPTPAKREPANLRRHPAHTILSALLRLVVRDPAQVELYCARIRRPTVESIRILKSLLLALVGGGIFYPQLIVWRHRRRESHRTAVRELLAARPNVILANNWPPLSLAVEAARLLGAPVILDLHEYSPLEFENRPLWKLLNRPVVDHFLRTYVPETAATITVCEGIAEKYQQEFGFRPTVVMNAPEEDRTTSFRPTGTDALRLIHHGAAMPDRRLDWMIETVPHLDRRFTLHFMLVGDEGYIGQLRGLAERFAPGRVFFHTPVAPGEICRRIADYDIGFFLLPMNSFNYAHALPNKLFDFISAGLAVCVGPSLEMSRIINRYDLGVVTPSCRPADVAATLNRVTAKQVDHYKQQALKARETLNAGTEMQKLLDLVASVQAKH